MPGSFFLHIYGLAHPQRVEYTSRTAVLSFRPVLIAQAWLLTGMGGIVYASYFFVGTNASSCWYCCMKV